MDRTVRLLIATLFGVIIFISKIFLPTPINDIFLVVQALLLAISSIVIGKFGATYTSIIQGLLVTMATPSFTPFGLFFSLVYGITIDGLFYAFRAVDGGKVKTIRSIAALTISTTITGLSSMYVTTMLGLVPMVPLLYLIILLTGILNGALAGYLTSIVWNKYLIHYFR